MIEDGYTGGDPNPVTDNSTSAEHRVGDYDGVSSKNDIVGDVNEIVDLAPVPYHGVTQGPTIQAGIRSDLDVRADSHVAEMRETPKASFFVFLVAETRQPNRAVCPDSNSISDPAIRKDRVGSDPDIVAEFHGPGDDGSDTKEYPVTQMRGR
ncbi:MAG: hypothetical protein V1495_06775 [Pseudomonadota bacterium]